jgi:hypothetical protein
MAGTAFFEPAQPGLAGLPQDQLPSVPCSAVDAAKVIGMADPFTPDAFYASAREFAHSALEAHHGGNHRCVPVFAGTAVEHLAKACLARRSPALLVEMRGNSGFSSLIALLRLEGGGVPARIRIVGLTEALDRVGRFVNSKAIPADLRTLVDIRNGVVHAADDTKVEESILTAFVQQAEALLADFGREREDFWKGQLSVVDALLAGATDKLRLRVEMKFAAAGAMLDRLYETHGEAVLDALQALSKATALQHDQRFLGCPVCGSDGIATGEHTVEWVPDEGQKKVGQVHDYDRQVWFTAKAFQCPVCKLRLDSEAEIDAAGMNTAWHIEDADLRDYEEPMDEDASYEHWREEREGL